MIVKNLEKCKSKGRKVKREKKRDHLDLLYSEEKLSFHYLLKDLLLQRTQDQPSLLPLLALEEESLLEEVLHFLKLPLLLVLLLLQV